MGHSLWSTSDYHTRAATLCAAGVSTFAYNDTVLRHAAESDRVIHRDLNPFGVRRESRDSNAHPNSRAIAVLLDITGSMAGVPRVVQRNLPNLMDTILRGHDGTPYLQDPQIMVGAIGDGSIDPRTGRQCDKAVLQVGQFESGIEIDNDLGKLWLEGCGGGQNCESYELALWFMLHKTDIDCMEKRNETGYLFIVGDENAYSTVSPREVSQYFGDTIANSIPTADVMTALKQKYDTYFLIPNTSINYDAGWLREYWSSLLGENVLRLADPSAICEVIANTIGLAEGVLDINRLRAGMDSSTRSTAILDALAPVAPRRNFRNVRI